MNKQEKHLADNHLQPIYYYEGKITVCLLRHGTHPVLILSRGVAICSPSDQFIKRIGRARALGMALRAFKHKESWGEIVPLLRRSRKHPIWQLYHKWGDRSTYEPTLTSWERTLIDKIILKDAGRE